MHVRITRVDCDQVKCPYEDSVESIFDGADRSPDLKVGVNSVSEVVKFILTLIKVVQTVLREPPL